MSYETGLWLKIKKKRKGGARRGDEQGKVREQEESKKNVVSLKEREKMILIKKEWLALSYAIGRSIKMKTELTIGFGRMEITD